MRTFRHGLLYGRQIELMADAILCSICGADKTALGAVLIGDRRSKLSVLDELANCMCAMRATDAMALTWASLALLQGLLQSATPPSNKTHRRAVNLLLCCSQGVAAVSLRVGMARGRLKVVTHDSLVLIIDPNELYEHLHRPITGSIQPRWQHHLNCLNQCSFSAFH